MARSTITKIRRRSLPARTSPFALCKKRTFSPRESRAQTAYFSRTSQQCAASQVTCLASTTRLARLTRTPSHSSSSSAVVSTPRRRTTMSSKPGSGPTRTATQTKQTAALVSNSHFNNSSRYSRRRIPTWTVTSMPSAPTRTATSTGTSRAPTPSSTASRQWWRIHASSATSTATLDSSEASVLNTMF